MVALAFTAHSGGSFYDASPQTCVRSCRPGVASQDPCRSLSSVHRGCHAMENIRPQIDHCVGSVSSRCIYEYARVLGSPRAKMSGNSSLATTSTGTFSVSSAPSPTAYPTESPLLASLIASLVTAANDYRTTKSIWSGWPHSACLVRSAADRVGQMLRCALRCMTGVRSLAHRHVLALTLIQQL